MEGSYSSILSKRLRNPRCSAPWDSRYSCSNTDRGEVCWVPHSRLVSPDSPPTAYTWPSRSVRLWSSGSSPDGPGGRTSAVCDERPRFITACFHWAGCTGVLPAPLSHPARNGPPDSLHHSQVLLVVVGLQTETSKTLTDKIPIQDGGRRRGRVTWYSVKPA